MVHLVWNILIYFYINTKGEGSIKSKYMILDPECPLCCREKNTHIYDFIVI